MDRKEHWDRVYATKGQTEVSWYQATPTLGLDLIEQSGLSPTTRIIDVGGGDSTLVDHLLERGAEHVTILDLSAIALARSRARFGAPEHRVTWIEADATRITLPPNTFDVWHDRAVFHFLTDSHDQARYVDTARHALKRGGHLIVTTFAPDGPMRCSGLAVTRYSPDALRDAFADGFDSVTTGSAVHRTPTGQEQPFTYCLLRRR